MSLRLFIRVCERGNISEIAEQAHLSASAISKRLAQLEAMMGTPLFTRKRHGMEPTRAGSTLEQHARAMLRTVGLIERDMDRHKTGLFGRVNILATASVLAGALPDHIAHMLKRRDFQRIQIDFEERFSPQIVRGIQEREAALGVCWDAAPMGELKTRPYTLDHLCVLVPKGHTLAKHATVRFEDTLGFEHVSMPPQSAVQVMLDREAALLGRSVKHRVIVTYFDASVRVVRAGLAISVVPREVLPPGFEKSGLAAIPLDEPWATRQFVICHRGEATLSGSERLVLEALTQCASST
jgi:DNA-binding transcriptional LysR family regulator